MILEFSFILDKNKHIYTFNVEKKTFKKPENLKKCINKVFRILAQNVWDKMQDSYFNKNRGK